MPRDNSRDNININNNNINNNNNNNNNNNLNNLNNINNINNSSSNNNNNKSLMNRNFSENYEDLEGYEDYEESTYLNKYTGVKTLILSIATALFAITLFDAIYGFKSLITPGINEIYNILGTQVQPNMVALVVFDWRAIDTLGEALILATAVIIVLLVFGRGIVEDEERKSEGISEMSKNDLKEDE